MDEASQLASAGLAIVLAAVLLILSYFFLESQSAKHPVSALRPNQVAFYQARGF
jgi:hypothetical protein